MSAFMANKVTVRDIEKPVAPYVVKYTTHGGDVYVSNEEYLIIDGGFLVAFIGFGSAVVVAVTMKNLKRKPA